MRKNTLVSILAAMSICLLTSIAEMFPIFLTSIFCYPAAALSQLHMGGILLTDNVGICCIKTNYILVMVTPECSGILFFLLLLSSVIIVLKDDIRLLIKMLPLLTLLLYILTIFLNSCRIVSSYKAKLLLPNFPLPFKTLHLAIGISIFLPALLFCYYGINKWFSQRKKQESTPII